MLNTLIRQVFGNDALNFAQNHSATQLRDKDSLLIQSILATMITDAQKSMTAVLNDEARADINCKCRLQPTDAFTSRWGDELEDIIIQIKVYSAFDSGITVFDERDFGVVFRLNDGSWTNATPAGDWSRQSVYWQFEYVGTDFSKPCTTPWDRGASARVLILMLPEEFI